MIGIDEYGEGIPLVGAQRSPTPHEIAKLLKGPQRYDEVLTVTEGVTHARLEAIFLSLKETLGPDDRLLVYYAGHGIAIDGDDGPTGYLVPQGASRNEISKFLSMVDLADWLDGLSCRHLLLVLDCCFAGAFRWSSTRDLDVVPEVIHKERYDRYIRDAAWQVITSAAHDQKAADVATYKPIGSSRPRPPGEAIIPVRRGVSSVVSVARRTSSLLAREGRPPGDARDHGY